ncbi:MAG: NCS2 family permease [Clostridia bacterium]|nr:NCS2 family permease [Clostridia bacterium]
MSKKTDVKVEAAQEKKVSKFDRFFKISERGSNVKTEIIAGLTTFFAMAYIVVTNPNQIAGDSFDKLSGDLKIIWYSVYVASILAAVVGTLLYAFYAKMPFAQACGMGLNSFFFVSFILPELLKDDGTTDVIKGYKEGLSVILLSGLLFMILSFTGLRTMIAKSLPDNLKKAIPAGIGLFIAFLGFQNVGIIQPNQYTLVQFFDFHGAWQTAETPLEGWRIIAPVLIAILGLIIMGVLSKFKVKGSVIITILGSTVLYYIATWTLPSFNFTSIGSSFYHFGKEGLFGAFEGFKTLFTTGGQFTWGTLFSVIALTITFCLVDMFDTMGTLYGAASQANMLDENGDPINMKQSMNADSIATLSGSLLGTSTCTTYVESSAGVGVGGRTGFASLITSVCFIACLFLTPLATIIPTCATAPALIYIGVLMLKGFAKVDMEDITSAIPAFLALVMMPLTYSISNGIAIGAISYVLLRLFTGKYQKKDIVITVVAVLFALRFALVTM